MLFNSYVFILLFLPLFVIGYFFLRSIRNTKPSLSFVLVMSLIFYGYNSIRYVPIILCSIVFNYILSRVLNGHSESHKSRSVLFMGIGFNLLLIYYFKYHNFFCETFNSIFGTSIHLHKLLLPLGISFFTFQQISYLVDSYRGETSDYTFLEYAAFVSFFPQLVAGPIVLHDELITQFRDNSKWKVNWDSVADGAWRFSMGLFKKVLIADTFSKAVAWGYDPGNMELLTSGDVFVIMLSYTFQIYFDFSGYSDMATGLAEMINIQLPINFDSPYQAFTIRDFWKRWHMTLTRFLTRYLYIPLGGDRKGKVRTYINMLVVFIASGIWHGANWTFILWGALHGCGCVLERLCKSITERAHAAIKWIITFMTVNVLWLLFRSESIAQWVALLRRLVRMENLNASDRLIEQFILPETEIILRLFQFTWIQEKIRGFVMLTIMGGAMLLCLCVNNNYRMKICKKPITAVVALLAMAWSLICLSNESVFLYFNF